ncbi:integrase [Gossypium australe]|uniref:Integrase n=1 Tax=Gossypium australe TaxID=47621 RepID=A0A5B6WRX6_9ROSI|nr:integrase [Gossypium australe]
MMTRNCYLNDKKFRVISLQNFKVDTDGMLYFRNRFSIKMFGDLKRKYWWPGIKRDISELVAKCLVYQQVKAKH